MLCAMCVNLGKMRLERDDSDEKNNFDNINCFIITRTFSKRTIESPLYKINTVNSDFLLDSI